MDFIERLFGVAPDYGSGAFELMWFVVPVLGIVAILGWRSRRPK